MRGRCSHLESNSFMLAAAVRVGTECCISMHELLSLITAMDREQNMSLVDNRRHCSYTNWALSTSP